MMDVFVEPDGQKLHIKAGHENLFKTSLFLFLTYFIKYRITMHINIDNYREIRVLSIRDNKGQYCMYT